MQTLPRITQTNLKVSFSRPNEWKIHKSDLTLLNIFSSYIPLVSLLLFLAVEEKKQWSFSIISFENWIKTI